MAPCYGTRAPKGRNLYEFSYRLQTSRQYLYGAAENDIVYERWYCRNAREAYFIGWEGDTTNGTAVGWVFLGATEVK